MIAVFVALSAATATAKTKRLPLDCKDPASIRDFKAAVVEDSGWDHALAEEWARYACPKEADAAGWGDPRPVLPAKWRGALPARDKNPKDRAWSVKSLVEGFLLYPLRPLPITRKQADVIGEGWYQRRLADLQAAKKEAAVAPK